jgi:hypothetical protein
MRFVLGLRGIENGNPDFCQSQPSTAPVLRVLYGFLIVIIEAFLGMAS